VALELHSSLYCSFKNTTLKPRFRGWQNFRLSCILVASVESLYTMLPSPTFFFHRTLHVTRQHMFSQIGA